MKIFVFLSLLFLPFGVCADEDRWIPPSEREGFVSFFMPNFEIPEHVFGNGQRKTFLYVGSIFESRRDGVNGYLLGEDVYAQVWAIRRSRWALLFPRCFFEYPGSSFGVPISENGGVGFALRISFR